MTFNPDQPRDYHGRWGDGGGSSVSAGGHANSVPKVGSYALGPGFTVNARTGKSITEGFAVAGIDKKAKALGGGAGWQTEHVNIANSAVLGKSLGRMRKQVAIYDLKNKKEILTGGKFDPAMKLAA